MSVTSSTSGVVGYQPPLLSPNPKREDWQFFKRLFENYLAIVEAKEEAKLPLLQNALGRDGLSIFDGLPKPTGADTYELAVKRCDTYFSVTSSVLLNRKRFFQARQGPSETSAEFAGRLRRLSADCQFSNASEMLRDVFVIGVRNDHLGERLLSEDASKLTFEAAVNRAETVERATMDRSLMTNASTPHSVLKIGGNAEASASARPKEQQQRNVYCYQCGAPGKKKGHPDCKAKDVECRRCGRRGHLAKVCRTKLQRGRIEGKANQVKSESEEDDFTIFAVSTDNHAFVSINDRLMKCVADTGASLNIMPKNLCPVQFNPVSKSSVKTYGGHVLKVVGNVVLRVSYLDKVVTADFAVVDVEEECPLLCTKLCKDLGILSKMANEINAVKDGVDLNNFECLFQGVGKIKNIKCDLKVVPEAVPKSFPS